MKYIVTRKMAAPARLLFGTCHLNWMEVLKSLASPRSPSFRRWSSSRRLDGSSRQGLGFWVSVQMVCASRSTKMDLMPEADRTDCCLRQTS